MRRHVCRPQVDLTVQNSKQNNAWMGWKQEMSQPLCLSLGCFFELGMLSYLIWKRTFRATCWYENQDHSPTDRYFMIIFWRPAGVCKQPSLFCLSLFNLLAHIRLPYIRWKGTSIALIWGIVACPNPRDYRDMAWGYDFVNLPTYCRRLYEYDKKMITLLQSHTLCFHIIISSFLWVNN